LRICDEYWSSPFCWIFLEKFKTWSHYWIRARRLGHETHGYGNQHAPKRRSPTNMRVVTNCLTRWLLGLDTTLDHKIKVHKKRLIMIACFARRPPHLED
jgi:hypothetical protein